MRHTIACIGAIAMVKLGKALAGPVTNDVILYFITVFYFSWLLRKE